jgi:hypothetical protein
MPQTMVAGLLSRSARLAQKQKPSETPFAGLLFVAFHRRTQVAARVSLEAISKPRIGSHKLLILKELERVLKPSLLTTNYSLPVQ